MKYICKGLEQTRKIASEFANSLVGGEIITLKGDLGAGKTTFTRFVLQELGVGEVVNSPTFSILKIYHGEKFEFYHFDAYRLGIDEAIEAGFDEMIAHKSNRITLIEWPQNIEGLIPSDAIKISFNVIDEQTREIVIL